MYSVLMDGLLLPTAPSKINTKINNQNETVNLINESEINILKKAGLTDIDFDMRIFHQENPYTRELRPVEYYLNFLEILKQEKRVFQFIVYRNWDDGGILYDSNMRVTLEDYDILEDSENVGLTEIKINLKQYDNYEDIKGKVELVDGKRKIVTVKERFSNKSIKSNVKAIKGETLWDIAKRELGDGGKYLHLARINGYSNPNGILNGGEVINLA